MSVTTISKPAPASASPMAAPMPRRAPVTRATGRNWAMSKLVQACLQVAAREERLGGNRKRGGERGGGRKEARVHHIEIIVIPGAAIRIQCGSRRVGSEARGAALVRGRIGTERLRQHDREADVLQQLLRNIDDAAVHPPRASFPPPPHPPLP